MDKHFSSYHQARRIPIHVKIQYVNNVSHKDPTHRLTDSTLKSSLFKNVTYRITTTIIINMCCDDHSAYRGCAQNTNIDPSQSPRGKGLTPM